MKKKTLLLALIPALLLAPSCSVNKGGYGMAKDAIVFNQTTNDNVVAEGLLLSPIHHNLVDPTISEEIAVSTKEEGDDLILSFAISESLANDLLEAGTTNVSVFYGYVPTESDSVSSDVVLANGREVSYDLTLGRVIRLIIKGRGTADYADKKYQGVLAYTLNGVQYVSDTKAITQNYEMITDDVTDGLVARYNIDKNGEETGENKYQEKKTYKLVGKANKYTGVRITTTQLKGNFAGAKLSFTCKTINAKQSGLFFKLTDEVGTNLSGGKVSDATCAPEVESTGVSRIDLGDGWYRFTIDFSTAFAAMQNVQMLPAAHPEFVFTSSATDLVPTIYIADIQLSHPERAALAQPNVVLQDKTITWNKVKNAESYSVYVNGTLVSTYTNSDELTYTDTHTDSGCYEMKVVASPSDKGYFLESSASAFSKIVDESKEADDISNKIEKNYGVVISDNYNAFYTGSHSKEIAIEGNSGAINLQASDLGGIEGKQLTFYVQVTNTDYLSTSYIHFTFQYYNNAGTKVGKSPTNYINFGLTGAHNASLGTSERIAESNWVKCTVRLDDPLFGDLGGYDNVKYVRIAIPDRCTFNLDNMNLSDVVNA